MRERSAAVLVLCLLLAMFASVANAQVSPGPLSRAHEGLEGVRRCRSCHGGGDELVGKCLKCHQAVAWTIEHDRGLHAREGRSECAHCHPEHGGHDFNLIDLGPGGAESFDHSRAGWRLDGAHSKLDCTNCHRAENRIRAITLRRPEGSKDATFLALDASCRSCHTDIHERRLGRDCGSCHGTTEFAAVESFDHARTGYALRGKHSALECSSCHQNGKFGRSDREGATRHLAPIAYDECSACHKDPHAGRFGVTCSKCHVEDDFRLVSGDRFDHDKTKYPLRGAHVRVKCARCHEPASGGWGAKPAFERCSNCHSDAHAETATLGGKSADCDACHEVGGFAPAAFDASDHANSRFPLVGKHAAVACAKCHPKSKRDTRFGSARVNLRPASDSCSTCHVDAHAGQFSARADGGACDACHTAKGWVPSSFDVSRHAESAMPLVGAHRRAPCAACHRADRPGLRPLDPAFDLGTAKWAFRIPERGCADCHVDVHRGRYLAGGERADLGPCEVCHDSQRFVPALVGFAAHDRYAFKLDGEHRPTPCVFCHENLMARPQPAGPRAFLIEEAGLEDVVLWGLPLDCKDCHQSGIPR